MTTCLDCGYGPHGCKCPVFRVAEPPGHEQRRREKKDRRERIATAAMQGILSNGPSGLNSHSAVADVACLFADALIAKLDEGE